MARSRPPKATPAEPETRWAQTVAERSTRSHGRRTLIKLLDAAVAEFATHGWHGARMARLAKRAGTAHGTVYAYFADKDDLLYALEQDAGSEIRAKLVAMPELRAGTEGFGALRDWVREVCELFRRNGPIVHAVAEAMSDEVNSRTQRAALRGQRRVLTVFADRIRACGTTAVDPEIGALSIYAMIEGGNEAVYRGELMVSDEELVAGIAEFIHRSMFGAEAAAG